MIDSMLEETSNIYSNGSYVRITQDQMTALLYLADQDIPYTKDTLYNFLQYHGVVKGYHTSNLAAMVKKCVYEREIIVAEGKSNKNGQDGCFEYTFDPKKYKTPKVRPDGSVDYSSVTALQNVKVGDVVAIYHPAVQGEDGYTITGVELKACLAKELPKLHGNGVAMDKETGHYKATMDGKVVILNDQVDIRSVHQVSGDVGLLTKKIEFPGDIIILGNVESGVELRAGRNIEVRGSVEAVNMVAGGDIILTRGIQGGQKAKLIAGGSVFADFIEHTTVEAGESVQTNSIISSKVDANEKVMLTGKRGLILGGIIHGLQGVEAINVGNEVEVKTVVHAGHRIEDQKEYFRLKKEQAVAEQHFSDLTEELNILQRNERMGSKTKNPLLENRITQIKMDREVWQTKLFEVRKQKETVHRVIQLGKDAQIIVDGNIYRGTVICVDTLQFPVEHNTCYMKYFSQGGKMERSVIIK